jgi:heme ABC exporter ATP-binding subunit CcmA
LFSAAMNTNLGVSLLDVDKRFGTMFALRRINLRIAPGEFVLLLGANGSGKTTFLRVVGLLARPSSGRIEFSAAGGEPAAIKRRIGVVAHSTMLYDELTAAENLEFFATLHAVPDTGRQVAQALEDCGLAARAKDLVRTFSRGMRQRLTIARALLHQPGLLLLDEPAAGLDRDGIRWLAAKLRVLQAQGCTILMSTHSASEDASLATRGVWLERGAVREDTGPQGNVTACIAAAGGAVGEERHQEVAR